MRTLPGLVALALTLSATACGARGASSPPASILPLRTLRLYETGVGYFERSGTLTSAERTSLPVPASHLDDALTSLVVLTPGRSDPLRGVAFGSSLSHGMARAMAGLPAAADAPITYRDLLTSLKGARVEIKMRRGTCVGRLIDVAAEEEDPKAPARPSSLRLVMLTDASEVVRVSTDEIASVRPTDGVYATRLGTALDALSAHSVQAPRLLDLLGASSGPVTLAYVAEAPVWRTTYRLVLEDDGKRGVLQAWALVHNDTDEDWQGVKVELVNGRPDSFLFPMAAPRYSRRKLVHPDDELSTVPQLLDKTIDAIWGDNADYGVGGLAPSGVGEGGGGTGDGIGLGKIGSVGHGRGTGIGSSSVLAVGDLAQIADATGTEAGALFVYAMPDRIALHSHASALVPFLQQLVDAESIAWVDAADEPARSAVRFTNSTAQTLPSGTISFFGDGGFAGESGLDRLKPGERRFLKFGTDLDVGVSVESSKSQAVRQSTERLTYQTPGELLVHYLQTSDTTYSFENRSGRPRAVYLALHLNRNAKVTGADTIDFDASTSTPAAVIHVAAKAKLEREIVSVEGLTRGVRLDHLTADELMKIAASTELAATDKTVAIEAIAAQKELETTRHAEKLASGELAAIEKEQARLREDTKALGGDRAGPPPAEFVRRLLAAEDRHAAARKRIDDARREGGGDAGEAAEARRVAVAGPPSPRATEGRHRHWRQPGTPNARSHDLRPRVERRGRNIAVLQRKIGED